jgi:hypothetical protein
VIVTATFERRTFKVQAIRVTAENIMELTGWCGGELIDGHLPATNAMYIRVPVSNITGRRQTAEARVGDWITRLTDANNFRVYKNKSFLQAFQEIADESQKYAEVHQIIVNAMHKQDTATYNGESSRGMDAVADRATRAILGLF